MPDVLPTVGGDAGPREVVPVMTFDAAGNEVDISSKLDAARGTYTTVNGAYVNNTARAAGRGILANITTGGTATLTFGGVDITFTFVVGPSILPLAITKTVLGTAVGTFYAIS